MEIRKINTKIWQDDWFVNLSRASKVCFLYLFTNQHIGFSGIYELSDRVICFDTGLSQAEIETCKKELFPKVVFVNGWVFVRNAEKHDPIRGEKNSLWLAREKELNGIPKEIKDKINEVLEGGYTLPLGGVDPCNGNGNGKGKEGGVGETARAGRAAAERIISVFNQAMGKKYSLTDKRYELIRTREKSYGTEQLETACRNLGRSAFHTGKNDRGWIADPDWLFKNDENVDKALNLESKKPKQKTSSVMDLVKGLNANA